MRIKHTTGKHHWLLSAMLCFAAFWPKPAAWAIVLTEEFSYPGGAIRHLDDVGASETPQRSDSTGFTWGGLTVATGGFGNVSLRLDPNPFYILDFGAAAAAPGNPGSYAYTIFDSTGGNISDITLNLAGGSIEMAQTDPGGAGLKIMIRTGPGNWFVADTEFVTVAGDSNVLPRTTSYAMGDIVSWTALTAASAANLDLLQGGDEQLLAFGSAAVPDLTRVDGGGVYVSTGNNRIKMDSLAWLEGPSPNDELRITGTQATTFDMLPEWISPLMRLELEVINPGGKEVALDGTTITISGGEDADIAELILYEDLNNDGNYFNERVLASGQPTGGAAIVSFASPQTISSPSIAHWLLAVRFNPSARGKTFTLSAPAGNWTVNEAVGGAGDAVTSVVGGVAVARVRNLSGRGYYLETWEPALIQSWTGASASGNFQADNPWTYTFGAAAPGTGIVGPPDPSVINASRTLTWLSAGGGTDNADFSSFLPASIPMSEMKSIVMTCDFKLLQVQNAGPASAIWRIGNLAGDRSYGMHFKARGGFGSFRLEVNGGGQDASDNGGTDFHALAGHHLRLTAIFAKVGAQTLVRYKAVDLDTGLTRKENIFTFSQTIEDLEELAFTQITMQRHGAYALDDLTISGVGIHPLVALEPGETVTAVAGNTFVTTATVTGGTGAGFMLNWSFDAAPEDGTPDTIVGADIVESGDSGTSVSVLTIDTVTAGHVGTYTVLASDSDGTTGAASFVLGLVPLALELEPASPASVVTNDVFVMTATASNAITYTMTWTFDPASNPGNTTTTIEGAVTDSTDGGSSVSVLTLDPVTAEHAGTYTIVALGSEGTGASAELVLTILPPVAIVVLPPSASILENTIPFVATATASRGKPPYQSMSWTRDGVTVTSGGLGGRLQIDTDLAAGVSILTLSDLVKINNDAGLYECTVVDDTGTTDAADSQLYVRDINDIYVQVNPEWDQVTSGGVYVVTGTASCGTAPYTSIGWIKDGIPLISGGKLLIETSLDNSSSTLTLSGVSPTIDGGQYLCEAVDNSGTTGTAIAVLVVSDILRLSSGNPAATLASDETYVVTAMATGGSLPYASFEWTGPNGVITAGVLTVGNKSTLTIVGAQSHHSGTYTCTVTDDDGVAVSVESTLTVGENLKARVKHWEIME